MRPSTSIRQQQQQQQLRRSQYLADAAIAEAACVATCSNISLPDRLTGVVSDRSERCEMYWATWGHQGEELVWETSSVIEAAICADLLRLAVAGSSTAAVNLPPAFYNCGQAVGWVIAVAAVLQLSVKDLSCPVFHPSSVIQVRMRQAVETAARAFQLAALAHPEATPEVGRNGVHKAADQWQGRSSQFTVQANGGNGPLKAHTIRTTYSSQLKAAIHHDLACIVLTGRMSAAINIRPKAGFYFKYKPEWVKAVRQDYKAKYPRLKLEKLVDDSRPAAVTAHLKLEATPAVQLADPQLNSQQHSSGPGADVQSSCLAGYHNGKRSGEEEAGTSSSRKRPCTTRSSGQVLDWIAGRRFKPEGEMISLSVAVSKYRTCPDLFLPSAETNARWMAATMKSLGHRPPKGYDSLLVLNPTGPQMEAAAEAVMATMDENRQCSMYWDGHGNIDNHGTQHVTASDGQCLPMPDKMEMAAADAGACLLTFVSACQTNDRGLRAAAAAGYAPKANGCINFKERCQRMNATRRGTVAWANGDTIRPDWAFWFWWKHTMLRRHCNPRQAMQAARLELDEMCRRGEVQDQVLVFNEENDNVDLFKHSFISDDVWEIFKPLDRICDAGGNSHDWTSTSIILDLKELEALLGKRNAQDAASRSFVLTWGLLGLAREQVHDRDKDLKELFRRLYKSQPQLLLPELKLPLALFSLAVHGCPEVKVAAHNVLLRLPHSGMRHYGSMPPNLWAVPEAQQRIKLGRKLKAEESGPHRLKDVPFVAAALELPAGKGGLQPP